MGSWGKELWDQRDVIEKHTHFGIDFLDKCASFMKERVRIEQEYAKSLRKLVKQYQFKKKEEEDLVYTYMIAFRDFLRETDDYAGQREVIAENIQEKILKEMQKLSMDSKSERKKAIQSLNELKSNLDGVYKSLAMAKRKYEQASDEADQALKAHDQANQSLELTKAQILKFQKASQEKGQLAGRARDDYNVALDNYNKAQTLYYDADFPGIINNEMQKPEEKRTEMLGVFFKECAEIQQKVIPIIAKCLEGMVSAAKSCNPTKDSATLIDNHRTGETRPGNEQFVEWGKGSQVLAPTAAKVTPAPSIKKQQKPAKPLFGMSNKKREAVTQEEIANDYAELPPAQRRKTFNKRIAELEESVAKLSKDRDGMLKMADTCKQFGGDLATIEGQLNANTKEVEKAQALLYQYQCYLAAMDNTEVPNPPPGVNVSTPRRGNVAAADATDLPPPPPHLGASGPPVSPADASYDEFDELRCTALYDFSGNNEGELSIFAGEELVIVEEDDGSGWTRVMRGDEEGYIPTSYVQRI